MAVVFEKSSEQQKSRKRGAESDAPSCSTSSMALLPQLYEKVPRADSVAAKVFILAQKKAIASLSDDVLDVSIYPTTLLNNVKQASKQYTHTAFVFTHDMI